MIISTQEAINHIKSGKLVIVVDDEDRENEGDFVIPTELLTPKIVNFMAKIGRGLICISLPEHRLNYLNIPKMVENNTETNKTAFHISCEAKNGVTTGISAYDRSHTMNLLVADDASAEDFVFPGHVFPLCAKNLGVLEREGHTEASADLAAIAGFKPSGVIVEIMDDDGKMARLNRLEQISDEFEIPITTIRDLIDYRKSQNLTNSLYIDWKY